VYFNLQRCDLIIKLLDKFSITFYVSCYVGVKKIARIEPCLANLHIQVQYSSVKNKNPFMFFLSLSQLDKSGFLISRLLQIGLAMLLKGDLRGLCTAVLQIFFWENIQGRNDGIIKSK